MSSFHPPKYPTLGESSRFLILDEDYVKDSYEIHIIDKNDRYLPHIYSGDDRIYKHWEDTVKTFNGDTSLAAQHWGELYILGCD